MRAGSRGTGAGGAMRAYSSPGIPLVFCVRERPPAFTAVCGLERCGHEQHDGARGARRAQRGRGSAGGGALVWPPPGLVGWSEEEARLLAAEAAEAETERVTPAKRTECHRESRERHAMRAHDSRNEELKRVRENRRDEREGVRTLARELMRQAQAAKGVKAIRTLQVRVGVAVCRVCV